MVVSKLPQHPILQGLQSCKSLEISLLTLWHKAGTVVAYMEGVKKPIRHISNSPAAVEQRDLDKIEAKHAAVKFRLGHSMVAGTHMRDRWAIVRGRLYSEVGAPWRPDQWTGANPFRGWQRHAPGTLGIAWFDRLEELWP